MIKRLLLLLLVLVAVVGVGRDHGRERFDRRALTAPPG